MPSSAQPLFRAGRSLWTWWVRELGQIFNFSLRRAKTPIGLVASIEDNGLILFDERDGNSALPGRSSRAENTTEALYLAAERGSPIRLRFPFTACFVRQVELPAAARDDAYRILALDLERVTPFRLKDVFWTYLLAQRANKAGMITAQQLILRRDIVQKYVEDIRRTGVNLNGIDCWNEDRTAPMPINFLPQLVSDPAKSQASRLNLLLAAAAVVAAIGTTWHSLSRYETALSDLTQTVERAREKTRSAQLLMNASDLSTKHAAAVQALKSARPSAAEILDSVTRLLPDSVWLTSLSLDGATLELNGEAKLAAALVPLIENSEGFSDASFSSAITRDGTRDAERFSIRARIQEVHAVGRPINDKGAP